MKYHHLLIIFFLSVWITLGLKIASQESPIFDEPVHLKAGALYAKGDFNFDPIELPLLRRFVYMFAQDIPSARVVIVVLTGIIVSILIQNPLTAILFLTEPNLIAHGHYLTTDAISAIVSVIAALAILSPAPVFAIALLVALSASLKVATLALIVPLLLIKAPELGFRKLIFVGIFSFIFIWATYGFRSQNILTSGNLVLPFGGYIRAIKENILFARRGQPIFFMGKVSVHASLIKTPLTILFKTSLPLLIFAAWVTMTRRQKTLPYWLILLIILFANLLKPLNFGIRHLLPAEIALVLIASLVKPKKVISWIFLSFLLLWQAVGLIRSFPQPITFTNELAGGKPYQIFSDSDYDWGQGLVELKDETERRGIKNYQLAYFGNVDPTYFLSNIIRIKDANPVGSLSIMPINYAKPIIISATCYYQCGYYLNLVLKKREPQLIAKSFLYYP